LEILKTGSEKARDQARPILNQLKSAMGWTSALVEHSLSSVK
jgi:hypothetical protein